MAITPDQYRALIGTGTKGKEKTFASENYSKTRKGWVEFPDGKRCYCKSRWEMGWCLYLQFLKEHGQILDWSYEPTTFWFEGIKRGTNNYTPDFLLVYVDGSEKYQEVKGYMDDKSRTKLKRMAKYHPTVTVEVVDKKRYKAVEKSVGQLIKGWVWL